MNDSTINYPIKELNALLGEMKKASTIVFNPSNGSAFHLILPIYALIPSNKEEHETSPQGDNFELSFIGNYLLNNQLTANGDIDFKFDSTLEESLRKAQITDVNAEHFFNSIDILHFNSKANKEIGTNGSLEDYVDFAFNYTKSAGLDANKKAEHIHINPVSINIEGYATHPFESNGGMYVIAIPSSLVPHDYI